MQPPEEYFRKLEAIFQKHAEALESEVRALQQADETAQWSSAWKKIYNLRFSQAFARQKVFRNWGADAAGCDTLKDFECKNKVCSVTHQWVIVTFSQVSAVPKRLLLKLYNKSSVILNN
ncbi:MAG: hypothetical protein VKN72_17500 [Nostocales cyanobacterium 94392]|nr:hypothetical protein [Nostocales cyanobacterium 94392]